MNTNSELTRREFLKSFSVSGAGFLIGIYLSVCSDAAPGMGTRYSLLVNLECDPRGYGGRSICLTRWNRSGAACGLCH